MTNTLTSYNFLATLTEQGKDLFQTVYIPICKRALCKYSESKKEYGSDTDIQNLFKTIYGLNVPITVVRQLIKGVEKEMSRKERRQSSLEILDNGKNFKISLFEFNRYEKTYQIVQKETDLLLRAFDEYARTHPEFSNDVEIFSFSEFIDRNKNRLTHFFRGEKLNGEDTEKSYLIHAHFIEHIRYNNTKLLELAEKLYFGSIVACYLEADIELGAKFVSNETYFIDTQIILRALDIQHENEAQAAQELISLIKNTGATPKVLGITISEIDHIYQVAIENYNNKAPTTTINEACLRKGKNKAWLISEQQKIESNIKNLGIEIDKIPQTQIEKYRRSEEIKSLQEERKKRANAEHDVLAYLHIRSLRPSLIRTYQKAQFWFVSSNVKLYHFNLSKLPQGVVGEIITPETLTSLLWLKSNDSIEKSIKKIGLNELMVQTIHEEIANKELINELHDSVKSNVNISEEEYKILLESVAHQSAKKLSKIIELSDSDKPKFNEEIHSIINKERERKQQTLRQSQETEHLVQKKDKDYSNLNDSFKQIEDRLEQTEKESKAEIDNLKSTLANQDTTIRKIQRNVIILSVSVVILLVSLLVIEAWNNVKIIITSISGLGGLWGFISLIINLLKTIKK